MHDLLGYATDYDEGTMSHYATHRASEGIMTQPKSSLHHSKSHRRKIYYGVARRRGAILATMAGRTAYREEFEPDHGPDRDESVDGTESGRELSAPPAANRLPVLLGRYSS